jgi:hypothetical protein
MSRVRWTGLGKGGGPKTVIFGTFRGGLDQSVSYGNLDFGVKFDPFRGGGVGYMPISPNYTIFMLWQANLMLSLP